MTLKAWASVIMKLLRLQNIKEICCSAKCTIIALLCVIFVSCESKQNPVYELLKFRTDVKKHCAEYSQEEWEKAVDEYVTICEKLDEMQFSTEERLEIDKVKGEIAGYAATVAAQEISDEVKSIANEIESFAEGFGKTFQIPR